MVGFNGILDTGYVEDLQMMKDKLIDGKELQIDLKVNQLKGSKMLMVDLIIILFLLKSDKFCRIWGYELVENDLL